MADSHHHCVSTEGFTPQDCAHFVLNPTSLQLIPAYSSQSSWFGQTLAGVGLSRLELGSGNGFLNRLSVVHKTCKKLGLQTLEISSCRI